MNGKLLHEDLATASSVASFETASTDGFRRDLEGCLSRIISETCKSANNSSSRGVLRYNPSHLPHCLADGIDWKSLCLDHDRRKERCHTTTNSNSNININHSFSSPLQELVSLLLDPRVVPLALASPLLRVLVRAFLLHSSLPSLSASSSRSPSQQALLQAIQRVMITRQCREDLGAILHTVNTTDLNFAGNSKGDPAFRVRRSVLSLIKYWFRELDGTRSDYCPIIALFPCLLSLIQSILSDERIPLSGSSAINSPNCTSCGINKDLRHLAQSQRRRVACADLAVLHGEVDEDDDEGGSNIRNGPKTIYHPNPSKPMSLKSVIQARDADETSSTVPCPNCQHVAKPQMVTTDEATLTAWSQLRDSCIHTMISSFQSTKFLPQRRPYRLLQSILPVACNSPCLRVCVLQLADGLGTRGYEYLFTSLWNRALEEDPEYFTWFTEVIVESTFCDKREQCWEAMQPLIKRVRMLCKDNSQDQQAPLCDNLLPCLGYVLSRRWRLLQSIHDDIYQQFSSFVTEVSWAFGEASDWVAPTDFKTEQQILETLQTLGIVSAFCVLRDDAEEERDIQDRSTISKTHALARLSIIDPKGLRRAYQRITFSPVASHAASHRRSGRSKYGLDPHLLSDPNHDQNQVPVCEKIVEGEPEVGNDEPDIPLLNYLDDDVLRNVLSFLGYKKLVKIRSVCSVWKRLADEDRFWFPLYRSRFGLLGYEKSVEPESKSSSLEATMETAPSLWKNRFVSKWVAAREIRFKCNEKKEFKYRICGYFGCHQVVVSPEFLNKHYDKHRRHKIKEQQRVSKRKAKKRKGADTSSHKRKSSGPPASAPKAPAKLQKKCTGSSPMISKPADLPAAVKSV